MINKLRDGKGHYEMGVDDEVEKVNNFYPF